MNHIQGEAAALLTALCWSFTSILFSLASKRIGSSTVNHLRLWVALVFLLLLHLLFFGTPFPFAAGSRRFFLFALSGLVGFVLGDACLFEAFVLIGPRLSMLLMVLAPLISAALAWVFLAESLGLAKVGAIVLTVAGIAWVVSAGDGSGRRKKRHLLVGVLLGVGGAVGQAVGALFSKMGLEGGFSPLSGNLIRVSAATLVMASLSLARGRMGQEVGSLRDRRALGQILGGALLGPVSGVVLSLYALSRTHMGVATTLMSLSPVLLLPLSHFLFKERVTFRAILGTLLAVTGAALLFFV